jgi:hypothetical protein
MAPFAVGGIVLASLRFWGLLSFGRQRGFSDCRYGTPIYWVCSSLQRSAARRPRPTWPMTGFPKPSRHPYHLSSIFSRRMRYTRGPYFRSCSSIFASFPSSSNRSGLRRQLKSFFLPGAFYRFTRRSSPDSDHCPRSSNRERLGFNFLFANPERAVRLLALQPHKSAMCSSIEINKTGSPN